MSQTACSPAATATSYRVRDLEVTADETASLVTGLWSTGLAASCDPRDRFDWYYRRGTEGPAHALLLELAEPPAEAIGCVGLGTRRFFLGEEAVAGALVGDLVVHPAHRTARPALTLLRGALRIARAEHRLVLGLPNPPAAGLLVRAGLRPLGRPNRWVRPLRHGRFVARLLEERLRESLGPRATDPRLRRASRAVAAPVGALLDAATLARLALSRRHSRRRPHLVWLAGPDERTDALFASACKRSRLLGDRRAPYLRWRFFERPGARAELAALAEPGRRTLRSYAVLEPDGESAALRDLLGVTPEDAGRLLDELLPLLAARGYEAVTFRYLGDPRLEAELERRGFRPRPSRLRALCDAPELELEAARCHLTEADDDG